MSDFDEPVQSDVDDTDCEFTDIPGFPNFVLVLIFES